MAVSHILGHGDATIIAALPATLDASRVALAGLPVWEPDQEPFFKGWGLTTITPTELNAGPSSLIECLRATGCSKPAIHLDVDTIDSTELVLGLGMEPNGLTRDTLIRTLREVAGVVDVVGITVAEYVPRQTIDMQQLLAQLPLIGE